MTITVYDTEYYKGKLPELIERKKVVFEEMITTPKSIVGIVNEIFNAKNRTEEYVWLVVLNINNKIIGVFEVAHGTVSKSVISPREIIMKSLLCGATGMILIHNHPGMKSFPSLDDIKFTDRLEKACKLMDLKLVDHIVIGGNNFTSIIKMNVQDEQE